MLELLTAAQMRAIERDAIDSGAVTGLELMERAGAGAVAAILAMWPSLNAPGTDSGPHRAVVLCGPGNNGGDGFVVARMLHARGWAVEVYCCGEPDNLPHDARANCQRWKEIGAVHPLAAVMQSEPGTPSFGPPCKGVVVDALFGTGLARPLSRDLAGPLMRARMMALSTSLGFVSLDCLSGVCCDSGRYLAPGAAAWTTIELCVTFHRRKVGHATGEFPNLCGRVSVVDIGLEDPEPGAIVGDVAMIRAPRGGRVATPGNRPAFRRTVLLPAATHGDRAVLVDRAGTIIDKAATGGHKFDHGHAMILSGDVGRGGAARLAARGALRIGAGLVTVGCPPAALIENAARLDAIMLRAVRDGDALTGMLEDARVKALCVGPGLGTGARDAGLVRAALGATAEGPDRTARGLVLDGDALTLLASDADLFALLHDMCVLTPHAGEFARLFPDIADRLDAPATTGPAFSKLDAARAAAARAGCTVVFKGPDTVIAAPDGTAAINAAAYERKAPWLATAGSGDVLAGFVTGLLARGWLPTSAAGDAAWLHVECALAFGPGLIAEDLPEQLPKVLRHLCP